MKDIEETRGIDESVLYQDIQGLVLLGQKLGEAWEDIWLDGQGTIVARRVTNGYRNSPSLVADAADQ